MANALVLGATGHIGAHIVRALLANGHHVRAAYRTERFLHVLDGLPVERRRVDLDTLEGLHQALDGCEWVFYAAGYYPSFTERRERALARGVMVTRRALEQIRQARPRRVVFTSSAATIRRRPDRAATERDAESWSPRLSLRPPTADANDWGITRELRRWRGRQVGKRPLYATVKVAMEREALLACEAGLPVVIVNPSFCLGEYDAHPFSGRAILAFSKHRLPVYVEHRFNAIYTGDVAVGHVRAAERGRLGERYLLTCRNVTLHEFASLVAAAAGVPPPRWRIPYHLAVSAAWLTEAYAWLTHSEPLLPRQAVHTTRLGQELDGAKALQELSLPQTPIEEAIQRALSWFRRHGYL